MLLDNSWDGQKQNRSITHSSSQILNWLGVIKCVSRAWRDLLINTPIDNCNVEEYPVNKELSAMTSKIAYQNLLKLLLSAPTPQKSLERVIKLTDIDWRKIYILPGITTIATRAITKNRNDIADPPRDSDKH